MSDSLQRDQITLSEESREPDFNRLFAVVQGLNQAALALQAYINLRKGLRNEELIKMEGALYNVIEELYGKSTTTKDMAVSYAKMLSLFRFFGILVSSNLAIAEIQGYLDELERIRNDNKDAIVAMLVEIYLSTENKSKEAIQNLILSINPQHSFEL